MQANVCAHFVHLQVLKILNYLYKMIKDRVLPTTTTPRLQLMFDTLKL